jgi:hypothetical protein
MHNWVAYGTIRAEDVARTSQESLNLGFHGFLGSTTSTSAGLARGRDGGGNVHNHPR